MDSVPTWLSSATADSYATAIGIVLVLLAAGVAAAVRFVGKKKTQNMPTFSSAGLIVDKSELIALPEAARLLYQHAREKAKPWARVAEGASGSHNTDGTPDDILNWMATFIVGKVRVFGCRPPSDRPELIENRHGEFESGALIYKTHNQTYNALAMSRHDLQNVISAMDEA